MSELRFNFHWNLFLRVQLTIDIGSGNRLSPVRRLAIIWTNVDPIHWCIYAALGRKELIWQFYLERQVSWRLWSNSQWGNTVKCNRIDDLSGTKLGLSGGTVVVTFQLKSQHISQNMHTVCGILLLWYKFTNVCAAYSPILCKVVSLAFRQSYCPSTGEGTIVADSIQRCRLSSIGISIVEIRRPSRLHNVISCLTVSLYWINALQNMEKSIGT